MIWRTTTASSTQSPGTKVFAIRQGELLGRQHAGYEAVLGIPYAGEQHSYAVQLGPVRRVR